jgi:hypothetical protein
MDRASIDRLKRYTPDALKPYRQTSRLDACGINASGNGDDGEMHRSRGLT